MDSTFPKKNELKDLMETTMTHIRDMVDSNSIVGEPITTPDGVTVIPISKMSFGFGTGGGNKTASGKDGFSGGGGAGVSINPVAFLVIRDGIVRVMPVAVPAAGTVDRVIELVPQIIDRVEGFIEKKKEKELF